MRAELELWKGSPATALEAVEGARARWPKASTATAGLADAYRACALADLAERARRAGDRAALVGLLRRVDDLVDEHRTLVRDRPYDRSDAPDGAAIEAWLAAEIARARGASEPARWVEAIRLDLAGGWRGTTAYHRWRHAEALEAAGASVSALRVAIIDGLADAFASEPARRELVSMADRLGIEVTTTVPPDDGAVVDPGGD